MASEPGKTEGLGTKVTLKSTAFSELKPQTARRVETLKAQGVGPDSNVNADQLRQLRVNQLRVEGFKKRQ